MGIAMKIRLLPLLAMACLLVAAAWLFRAPDEAHADAVPEKYRETVQKGLDYLARQQHKDGHWEGDGGAHPVAMTGLAGLAMLMKQGDTYRGFNGEKAVTEEERKHVAKICKAADWLIDQSRPGRDGLLFSEHPSEASRYMQGHGLATLFLAGVHQIEQDEARRKKLADVLEREVKYIVKAQSTQGGWYDTSKAEGHDFASIQASVLQIQALVAAENSGIPIPQEPFNDGIEYLKTALAALPRDKDRIQQRSRLADTAGVLAACSENRQMPREKLKEREGVESEEATRLNWFKFCRAKIPMGPDLKFGRDELVHYWYAQAEWIDRGYVGKKDVLTPDHWKDYRTALFDQLQKSQNKDGSWPAGDGICIGPVYSTALWCTVLQLDGNGHPASRVVAMARK
jgi:hypothetical protein